MLDRSLPRATWWLALVLLTACEASPPPTGGDASPTGGDASSPDPRADASSLPRADGGTSTGEYTCCLDDAFYDCPDRAAFDACAGFDIGACLAACSPADPMCQTRCFDMQTMATHDPSQCTRDASRDGTCGSSTGCGSAVAGARCDYDADCSSGNCTDSRCYGNSNGNLCEYDADCDSSNCTDGCCWSNAVGSACEYDADCTSSNCTDGTCRGNGDGSACEYDADCDSSSCTDGRCD